MALTLRLRFENDNTRAIIESLAPGCTMESVVWSLNYQGVINGIDKNAIGSAIETATRTGSPVFDILAAHTPAPVHRVKLGASSAWLSAESFIELRNRLTRIYHILDTNSVAIEISDAVFITGDEEFLFIDQGEQPKNIFGKETPKTFAPPLACQTRQIQINCKGDAYVYRALSSGYLALNQFDELVLIDPFVPSDDHLLAYFRILPVSYGQNSLVDKFLRSLNCEPREIIAPAAATFTAASVTELMKTKRLSNVLIREGKKPVVGRNASMAFLVEKTPVLRAEEQDKIDFKELSHFKEISAGTVLAEKSIMIPSVPGIDVFGNIISVDPTKDVIFNVEDNIKREMSGDRIRYIAAEQGVLVLTDTSVKIVTLLHVHSDVSYESGTIRFSRDIIIDGHVRSGFSVFCGGNLTIKGSIEEDTSINCGGNLSVLNGIFGEKTKIAVAGNAEIGFVHQSQIMVRGDLTIKKYCYHGNIRCNGAIAVQGHGMNAVHRGSVVGGKVSALRSISLHSAGSAEALTRLYSGIDPDLYTKLKEIEQLSIVLKTNVAATQRKIGMNLSNPLAAAKLKNMPPVQREMMKRLLASLRDNIAMNAKTEEQIVHLRQNCMAPPNSNPGIHISHQAIPELILNIQQSSVRLTERRERIYAHIINGLIAIEAAI